jgi:hypothetical protein
VADGARVVNTARTQKALDGAVAQLGGADHALGVAGRADDLDHQAAGWMTGQVLVDGGITITGGNE